MAIPRGFRGLRATENTASVQSGCDSLHRRARIDGRVGAGGGGGGQVAAEDSELGGV